MIEIALFIALALVVVIAVVLVLVALQPAAFRYERSAYMEAPPTAVFAQVNDLHQWDRWSPWAKKDPNMEKGYAGADAGVGAVYTWSGNNEIGEGKLTITESVPNERIRVLLEFVRPFKGRNNAEFTFVEKDGGTVVTWAMFGENNFVAKGMGLFMNMDKMIGNDFEQGLADMKALAENKTET